MTRSKNRCHPLWKKAFWLVIAIMCIDSIPLFMLYKNDCTLDVLDILMLSLGYFSNIVVFLYLIGASQDYAELARKAICAIDREKDETKSTLDVNEKIFMEDYDEDER